MKASDMVVVNLNNEVVEGDLRPSSDTPTHVEIYKAFADAGVLGVVHTHSTEATALAQAGRVIVEAYKGINLLEKPVVLVAGHAPFTWGKNANAAVDNAIALEEFAKMARLTEQIAASKEAQKLPDYVGEKYYQRKHGKNAYYGQN